MGGWGWGAVQLLNTQNALYQKRRQTMYSPLSLVDLQLKETLNGRGGLKRTEMVKSWWLIYVAGRRNDDRGVGSGNRHCLRCGFPEGGLLFCLITWARPWLKGSWPYWSLIASHLLSLGAIVSCTFPWRLSSILSTSSLSGVRWLWLLHPDLPKKKHLGLNLLIL